MTGARRNDFDVTNTVQVSSPHAVRAAVETLFRATWTGVNLAPIGDAFDHFERLFAGEVPGYFGVDTVYHDRQHTLDITLALARLIVGYERQQEPEETRFGAERAVVGVITGLFHDVGYLRRAEDAESRNGAEFTRTHVVARRALPRGLPADGGPRRLGADRHRDRALHRLRSAVREDQGLAIRATSSSGTSSAPPT